MDRRHAAATPRVLGLTGPIACGKTTVGDILLDLGALDRIDADQVVHALQEPGTPVTRDIVESFGPVLDGRGAVDRAQLGTIVFSDPAALRRLEAIVHPAVRQEIRQRIAALSGKRGVVVIEAVKLLQSDLLPLVETVWVVRCNRDTERRRLLLRGHAADDADRRLEAQPEFDRPEVSAVIENDGSIVDLREQVERLWHEFTNGDRGRSTPPEPDRA